MKLEVYRLTLTYKREFLKIGGNKMNKCEDCKYRAYEEDGEVYFYSDGSYEGGICREEYCSRGYEKV